MHWKGRHSFPEGMEMRAFASIVIAGLAIGCGDASLTSPASVAEENRTLKPAVGTEIPISFTGTVVSIEYLGRWTGTLIPVDFDSRFAATVKIESADGGQEFFKAGETVTFGIHSPVKLFQAPAEQAVGKQYKFTVYYHKTQDGVEFRTLTAQ